MIPPPRKLLTPPQRRSRLNERPKSLWIYCKKCGIGRMIASGFIAWEITRAEIAKSAEKMGWQVLPTLLCDHCSLPITMSERLHVRFLIDRIRYAKSDNQHLAFAKNTEDFLDYCGQLLDKYGADVFKKFVEHEKQQSKNNTWEILPLR